MDISVIIPTYNNPQALHLCIQSCIVGQTNESNEIIVVCDGTYEVNKHILELWKGKIKLLNLPTNQGLCKGTNLGAYNATKKLILIVNDDNVFPLGWDEKLLKHYKPGVLLTPNQIEPSPSIFGEFHIEDCGKNPSVFDKAKFDNINLLANDDYHNDRGSTLPIFMDKMDYMRVGGWDENYPTNGIVADWDFFLKCSLSGMEMRRSFLCHFYHFGSLTVNNQERIDTELNAHEYAKYKWGSYIKSHPTNYSKYL